MIDILLEMTPLDTGNRHRGTGRYITGLADGLRGLDASALTEGAGDAALFVPVGDASAFAQAIRRVVDDGAFRAWLREKGPRAVARFTWDACACARATLDSYLAALG